MAKLTEQQLAQIQEYLKSLPEEERETKAKEIMSQFEEQEPQCPFCLMSEGKIKTTRLYEDENFIAVLEINPANKGHTIIFTKRHIKSYSQLNEQETESLTKIIKKISIALSMMAEGVNVLESEGKTAGQRFDHFTINIIPRTKDDQVKIIWQPQKSSESDLEKVKQEIIENIPKEKPKEVPVDEEKIKKHFTKIKKRLP